MTNQQEERRTLPRDLSKEEKDAVFERMKKVGVTGDPKNVEDKALALISFLSFEGWINYARYVTKELRRRFPALTAQEARKAYLAAEERHLDRWIDW